MPRSILFQNEGKQSNTGRWVLPRHSFQFQKFGNSCDFREILYGDIVMTWHYTLYNLLLGKSIIRRFTSVRRGGLPKSLAPTMGRSVLCFHWWYLIETENGRKRAADHILRRRNVGKSCKILNSYYNLLRRSVFIFPSLRIFSKWICPNDEKRLMYKNFKSAVSSYAP